MSERRVEREKQEERPVSYEGDLMIREEIKRIVTEIGRDEVKRKDEGNHKVFYFFFFKMLCKPKIKKNLKNRHYSFWH